MLIVSSLVPLLSTIVPLLYVNCSALPLPGRFSGKQFVVSLYVLSAIPTPYIASEVTYIHTYIRFPSHIRPCLPVLLNEPYLDKRN
ncbi:hypothetical protein EDD16DRAFT_1168386 [Pisolithus croceorrhizus]|nr:hypothetical protein EDD16DRAFT_1168386 [Pisolithus croceorrhizus]